MVEIDPYDVVMYQEMYESDLEFLKEMYEHSAISYETYRNMTECATATYMKLAKASAMCDAVGEATVVFFVFFWLVFWVLFLVLLWED